MILLRAIEDRLIWTRRRRSCEDSRHSCASDGNLPLSKPMKDAALAAKLERESDIDNDRESAMITVETVRTAVRRFVFVAAILCTSAYSYPAGCRRGGGGIGW